MCSCGWWWVSQVGGLHNSTGAGLLASHNSYSLEQNDWLAWVKLILLFPMSSLEQCQCQTTLQSSKIVCRFRYISVGCCQLCSFDWVQHCVPRSNFHCCIQPAVQCILCSEHRISSGKGYKGVHTAVYDLLSTWKNLASPLIFWWSWIFSFCH